MFNYSVYSRLGNNHNCLITLYIVGWVIINFDSNNGSSNCRHCFWWFSQLSKFAIHFYMLEKNYTERMSGSSETYLFDSGYNIDMSNKDRMRFKNMRFLLLTSIGTQNILMISH